MWLLDTVTICEPTKNNANQAVLDWLADQDQDRFYTSVLCIGEIRRGIERMAPGAKRTHLRQWMSNDLPGWFGPRILPVDQEVAHFWGELTAMTKRTIPAVDSLIAATASHHRLTVVTRNVKDFADLEIDAHNPWQT